MNTQSRLSDLDAMKLANLRLRQQLLTNESQTFERDLFATYGNPGETMTLATDNSIQRTPEAPPAPAAAPKTRKR